MGKELSVLMGFRLWKGKGDTKTGFNLAKLLSHISGTLCA